MDYTHYWTSEKGYHQAPTEEGIRKEGGREGGGARELGKEERSEGGREGGGGVREGVPLALDFPQVQLVIMLM